MGHSQAAPGAFSDGKESPPQHVIPHPPRLYPSHSLLLPFLQLAFILGWSVPHAGRSCCFCPSPVSSSPCPAWLPIQAEPVSLCTLPFGSRPCTTSSLLLPCLQLYPHPHPPTPTLAPTSDQGSSLLMQSAFRTTCSLWGSLCKPFKSSWTCPSAFQSEN